MVNLTHTPDSYTPSPFMSFVGIEGSGSTQTGSKHQLWDWDTPNTLSSTPQNFPFYAAPPLLDGPPPSLFNPVPLPVYFPPLPQPMAIPEYHQRASGFFKLEDGLSTGFGGQASARIGLNLGHRTYFSSYDQLLLFGRSAHHQPPRCQAEGCMADLSGAKHYHRRHKVCDFHSKAAVVFFPGGVQQRFCQQCSRFHGLAEFDDAKRSCRKRLAEHNRRRRKAQPPSTIKGGSPSSLPPRINSEEGKLISTSKGNMQLSGVGASIQEKRASTIASMEEKISQYQQFHGHFASPTSSSNTFFQNHFNEGSNSTTGGSEMSHQNQNSILQLGQAMFEWDFI